MATVTGLFNDYWSLPRVKPNYQAQIESFDKIAAYKNQQYEKAYSYINQLKQTTLSMDFMKKEYKDKMDTYNTELNELFKNKDLRSVDLSESKIANTYVGWFDKVANDKELIAAYKYEGTAKADNARIKAGARAHDLSYSHFMHGLKKASVLLNRKMLSQLAIFEPKAFTQLVSVARQNLS